MNTFELVATFFLVATSAFFSSSEVALFSLSRFQLRNLRDNFRGAHKKIRALLNDPGGLLITILVGNEVVNISLSTLITNALTRKWNDIKLEKIFFLPEWALITLGGTLITAPIILILCEISPKVIGTRANQIIAPLFVTPLTGIHLSMKPVRLFLQGFMRFISSRITRKNDADVEELKEPLLREEDFLIMLEKGHKEGAIKESELDLIKNILTLEDTKVETIYTPIAKVPTLPAHITLKEALLRLQRMTSYRIPVVGKNKNEVQGILYVKDILKARFDSTLAEETVESVMRKPYFIASSMRVRTLFRAFKSQKTHLGIVVNAKNEAIGIITMDDVLEEIFEGTET